MSGPGDEGDVSDSFIAEVAYTGHKCSEEESLGRTLCFSRNSLLRGALMITRRTLEGAEKWALRDFLREEWRAIDFQVSTPQDEQGTEASYMCLSSSWRRWFDIVASCLMKIQAGALNIVGAKTSDANDAL